MPEVLAYSVCLLTLLQPTHALFLASGGKHKALRLEFTLPSSVYATMAVRELLKMDTSPSYQARLDAENGLELKATTTSSSCGNFSTGSVTSDATERGT